MSENGNKLQYILPEIREYTIDILIENEDRCLYTNVGQLYRMRKYIEVIQKGESLSEEEALHLELAFYVSRIHSATSKIKKFDFSEFIKHNQKKAKKVAEKFELEEETLKRTNLILKEIVPVSEVTLPESKVLRDAILMDFTGGKGRDHLKLLYEEMLIRDMELSKESWYDILLDAIDGKSVYTQYGEEYIQPQLEKVVKKIKKEKKNIEHKNSLLLKKELGINDSEIKKLKKDIKAAAGRDERAVQTLFRTTLKNHYTLNQMVDRKSSIMITVNSIILSMIMGGVFRNHETLNINSLPIMLLSIACIGSIFFAILSIIPSRTQGDFSEEEVRNKEGNLLYFGNFHNMHLRDFEWGFLQLINDKEYLYTSMIRDYYFLGAGLNKKYRFIRASLRTFLAGFGTSFIAYVFLMLFTK